MSNFRDQNHHYALLEVTNLFHKQIMPPRLGITGVRWRRAEIIKPRTAARPPAAVPYPNQLRPNCAPWYVPRGRRHTSDRRSTTQSNGSPQSKIRDVRLLLFRQLRRRPLGRRFNRSRAAYRTWRWLRRLRPEEFSGYRSKSVDFLRR